MATRPKYGKELHAIHSNANANQEEPPAHYIEDALDKKSVSHAPIAIWFGFAKDIDTGLVLLRMTISLS